MYIKNPKSGITKIERQKGWILLELNKIIIIACYMSPNKPIEEFKKTADEIVDAIKQTKKEAIVLGDINAKSPEYHQRYYI